MSEILTNHFNIEARIPLPKELIQMMKDEDINFDDQNHNSPVMNGATIIGFVRSFKVMGDLTDAYLSLVIFKQGMKLFIDRELTLSTRKVEFGGILYMALATIVVIEEEKGGRLSES